jgi:AraC-like DNA-binding protein
VARREATKLAKRTDEAQHRGGRMHGHTACAAPISRESQLSMRVLRGLVQAAERAGVPRASLLARAGIAAVELDAAEARLPRSVVYRVLEHALELSGDPALGLHWGRELPDQTFVPVTPIVLHSPTLREGFQLLERYLPLVTDQSRCTVVERDDEVLIQAVPLHGEALPVQRFSDELFVAGFLRIVRGFLADVRPTRVAFMHDAPSYAREYALALGVEVMFGQSCTEVAFTRALLAVPSLHSDAGTRDALSAVAEQRLQRVTASTPWALRVRDYLVREGWPYRTDMRSAARALGLSVRTLRRKLDAEEASYTGVLSEAMALVAKGLVADGRRSLQDVAEAMGFSDTSTFHRAFRRWTGTTPCAFRAQQQAPRDADATHAAAVQYSDTSRDV